MPDASVSFAGNLTDDPELRHTDGGIARATFRVAVSGRREQGGAFRAQPAHRRVDRPHPVRVPRPHDDRDEPRSWRSKKPRQQRLTFISNSPGSGRS